MVHRSAVTWLQWVLSAVILLEAMNCILSSSGSHHFGLPPWIAPALCGSEIVAVLLFVIPAVSRVGGYLLLFILAIAVLVHVLHGQLNVGALIVYGMAVMVCLPQRAEALHDR